MFSSLTEHPMFRRQAKFCVKTFLGHIVFKGERMPCPFSWVIYWNWSQSCWKNDFFLFSWHHANSTSVPWFKSFPAVYCVWIRGVQVPFMTQASAMNNGKRIGIFRGAGTRFATWFYALHCLLHQKKARLATIHSPSFATLAPNA